MANIDTEKVKLRKQIISAANIYKDHLAGKVFLYVFGNQYFEVAYQTECFKHLTGVHSVLRGNSFYDNAKNSTLSVDQIEFNSRHPLKTAKKKLNCLQTLPQLTTNLVCVVHDMYTTTITYKIGITNLEFTVGLTENRDLNHNKINDWFIPQTLRIKDKAIESSANAEFVNFIFSKDAPDSEYNQLCYADSDYSFPENLHHLLSAELVSQLVSKDKVLQSV